MADNRRHKSRSKEQRISINLDTLFLFLFLALVLAQIFNLLTVFGITNRIKGETDKQKELARPADLKLMKIIDSSCKSCFEINDIIEEIKQKNVKLLDEKTVEFNSQEGRGFISKYNIQKIPALIITGEVNKSVDLEEYFKENGKIVGNDTKIILFTNIRPPYFDLTRNKVAGLVSIISIVDTDCKECSSLNNVLVAFKASNVEVSDTKTVEYNSDEGRELIRKYEIQRIPAIVISNDIKEYEDIYFALSRLNVTEKDGNYALHTISPPYLDVKSGKTMGLTTLIMLSDSSCDECYNVTTHKSIIPNFGIIISKESSYDISSSEGKKLVGKYNITKVPTIVLSSDAKEYPQFLQVWNSVGTVEKDNWFVFRKIEVMGTYKDLTSNEVVAPPEGQ